MERNIDVDDARSLEIISEAARVGSKPIADLLLMAYGLGHARGGMDALKEARDKLRAAAVLP